MTPAQIDRNPSERELRQFAVFWFPLFWALAGWLVLRHGGSLPVAAALWGLGALALAIGAFTPRRMRPAHAAMARVFFPVGWIVSHVILAVIYYGAVTPIGLILRLLGRRPLEHAFDPRAASYWRARGPERPPEDYFKQF